MCNYCDKLTLKELGLFVYDRLNKRLFVDTSYDDINKIIEITNSHSPEDLGLKSYSYKVEENEYNSV